MSRLSCLDVCVGRGGCGVRWECCVAGGGGAAGRCGGLRATSRAGTAGHSQTQVCDTQSDATSTSRSVLNFGMAAAIASKVTFVNFTTCTCGFSAVQGGC